jgi:ATPase subunit of ABC transporter with duplicated ATPase domains
VVFGLWPSVGVVPFLFWRNASVNGLVFVPGKISKTKDLKSQIENPKSKRVPHPLIIAIDGPSGSGKSTLGRLLARALNLLYIDTGSMYRAVALAVIESQLDPADPEAVTLLAERLNIDLTGDPDSLRVLL